MHKLNSMGRIVATYQGVVREVWPSGVRLDASWTRPTLTLGYTTFDTGDHFSEWFFTDRWYNIFAVSSPHGRLKGWYCNVAEPATIDEAAIFSRDLLLDLWVDTQFNMTVLDEDEFAADQSLSVEVREHARRALDQLRAHVRRREPPFMLHYDLG